MDYHHQEADEEYQPFEESCDSANFAWRNIHPSRLPVDPAPSPSLEPMAPPQQQPLLRPIPPYAAMALPAAASVAEEAEPGKRKRRKTAFADYQVFVDSQGDQVLNILIQDHNRPSVGRQPALGREDRRPRRPSSGRVRYDREVFEGEEGDDVFYAAGGGAAAGTAIDSAGQVNFYGSASGALATASDARGKGSSARTASVIGAAATARACGGQEELPFEVIKKTPGVQNAARRILEWLQQGPLTLMDISQRLTKLSRVKVQMVLDVMCATSIIQLVRRHPPGDIAAAAAPPAATAASPAAAVAGTVHPASADAAANHAGASDSVPAAAAAAAPAAAAAAAVAAPIVNVNDPEEFYYRFAAGPVPPRKGAAPAPLHGMLQAVAAREQEAAALRARLEPLQEALRENQAEGAPPGSPAQVAELVRQFLRSDHALEQDTFYAAVRAAAGVR
ncbi:unnamed protein product [Phaeothamnion confervicola]